MSTKRGNLRGLWGRILGLLTVALLMVSVGSAYAQQSVQDLSQQQLQTYAKAAAAVRAVTQEYDQRIAETDSKDRKSFLRAKAQQEKVLAIDKAGITISTYNAISSAMESDEALRQEVQTLIAQVD